MALDDPEHFLALEQRCATLLAHRPVRAALNGRDRLRDALAKRGFPLR